MDAAGRLDPDRAARVTRLLWQVVMALPLAVVVAGMVGVEAFSRATMADAAGAVKLEYDRLDRFAAPTTLRVQLAPRLASHGRYRLSLNYGYVDAVRIRRIFPTPERIESAKDGLVFVFKQEERHKPLAVVFQLEGFAYGQLEGEIAAAGRPGLAFHQYLLP